MAHRFVISIRSGWCWSGPFWLLFLYALSVFPRTTTLRMIDIRGYLWTCEIVHNKMLSNSKMAEYRLKINKSGHRVHPFGHIFTQKWSHVPQRLNRWQTNNNNISTKRRTIFKNRHIDAERYCPPIVKNLPFNCLPKNENIIRCIISSL